MWVIKFLRMTHITHNLDLPPLYLMTGEELMKLVSYLDLPVDTESPTVKLGALLGEDCVVDLAVAQTWAQGARGFRARQLPTRAVDLVHNWEEITAHLDALLATTQLVIAYLLSE